MVKRSQRGKYAKAIRAAKGSWSCRVLSSTARIGTVFVNPMIARRASARGIRQFWRLLHAFRSSHFASLLGPKRKCVAPWVVNIALNHRNVVHDNADIPTRCGRFDSTSSFAFRLHHQARPQTRFRACNPCIAPNSSRGQSSPRPNHSPSVDGGSRNVGPHWASLVHDLSPHAIATVLYLGREGHLVKRLAPTTPVSMFRVVLAKRATI